MKCTSYFSNHFAMFNKLPAHFQICFTGGGAQGSWNAVLISHSKTHLIEWLVLPKFLMPSSVASAAFSVLPVATPVAILVKIQASKKPKAMNCNCQIYFWGAAWREKKGGDPAILRILAVNKTLKAKQLHLFLPFSQAYASTADLK